MTGKITYVVLALCLVQPALFHNAASTAIAEFKKALLDKIAAEKQFAKEITASEIAQFSEITRFNRFILSEADAIREAVLKDLCLKEAIKPPFTIPTTLETGLKCARERNDGLIRIINKIPLSLNGFDGLGAQLLSKLDLIKPGDAYSPLILVDIIRIAQNIFSSVIELYGGVRDDFNRVTSTYKDCVDENIRTLKANTNRTSELLKQKC